MGKLRAKIDAVEGIGPLSREKIAKAGIARANHPQKKYAAAKGRAAITQESRREEHQRLKSATLMVLMRVRGAAPRCSALLGPAGVDTVKELPTCEPDNLHPKIVGASNARSLVARKPNLGEVARWIVHAKTLSGVITH
jgi:hypothetical protein